MKRSVEVMEILEAFDLTGSYRAAAALTGCDHKTVARYVRERDRGRAPGEGAQRRKRTDPFLAKLEEWIERSRGRLRADLAHRKLLDLGYAGSAKGSFVDGGGTLHMWTDMKFTRNINGCIATGWVQLRIWVYANGNWSDGWYKSSSGCNSAMHWT